MSANLHRDKINTVIRNAWRKSTSSRYDASISQFLEFVITNSIPLSACLPASESLLCAFAASFAGSLAGKTIGNKCAAIRSWHIQNGFPYRGGRQLSYVIKGAENMRPADSHMPPRPAVSEAMLAALSSSLDLNDSFDLCVLAIATTSFWGQIRLGEILPPREKNFNTMNFPCWSDFQRPNSVGSRVLHLPCTKTGGSKGEDVIITRQLHLDPIAAIESHSKKNCHLSSDCFASYYSPSGLRLALTKRKFLARCNSILTSHSLPAISGHCFRIGGTTFLLLAGVPPDIVKLMGRWSSDSFLRYWRSLEIIAPLYAELLSPILRTAGLFRPSA
ncbi:hypothetical protein Hypma_008189 [Hypsizygus marmoreus]|uniref:Tyr recombinase domain-containing protein n=1 Tax=Hypsizygus marmoreus TaxID=39966 RepID=A0A369JYB0_HYPMA|nr:hypothetical protein Hypma_008189 [Hypsizygus marmoreus]